jgi:putative ABC transport system permease protein
MMQMFFQDLRYGARTLLKRPGFTAIAILTLALGIGANTAIFSVINAVLLRALPYPAADRLVLLSATTAGDGRDLFSLAEAQEFQAQMPSLEDMTAFQSQSVNLTGGERPDRVRGAFVTVDFFKVFNLTPIVGRTFIKGEDQPGAEKTVIVKEKVWRDRLQGDPNLGGKKLILNGEPYGVIGVISSAFKQPFDTEVEVWMGASQFPGNTGQRDSRFLFAIGHLKPAVKIQQAHAEAGAIASRLRQSYPQENAGRGAQVESFRELMVGDLRRMLMVLFAAVGVILLIACANLANLLLARGLARQREIALRAALGASRWRLIRQLLTETTLIGLLGGIGGIALAQWGLYGLLKLPQNFVETAEVRVDVYVLLFALGVSVLTGWLFGLAPALQLARPELHEMLKEGGRSGESARWNRLRGGFVVIQIALSMLLLMGGGLLLRSFDKLLRVSPGFKPENLLTLEYRLPRNKYKDEQSQWDFHRQVAEQVARIPGVKSASLVRGLPFSGNGGTTAIILPDRQIPPQGQEPQVQFNTALPNYFETIGIPFVKGRLFDDRDRAGTPAVFLINQTMARRFWPNDDPLGKQVKMVEGGVIGTVIGVVGDAKQFSLEDEARPQMYAAYSQQPGIFATLVARTSVEPMTLAEAVRQAVWRVDRDQPMWKIRTVEYLLDQRVADRRFVMALMGIFAALALVLTVIGLYGVISYIVNQRTPEIGIRLALGAQVKDILGLVLRQGMTLVLIGIALGLSAAWMLTRLMADMLYGISATDPTTFIGITLLLTIVAALACWIPARRATKVDPIIALSSTLAIQAA